MRRDAGWARDRFAGARVARLATAAHGVPHLVPIVYAIEGDAIHTAVDAKPKSTAHLRRLANIRANPQVSVLVDEYAEDWSALWWARADGLAAVVASAEAARPLAALCERYPQYAQAPPPGPLITVTVTAWSGWSAR